MIRCALVVAVTSLGCSAGFGLAQTAKTVEPGGGRMTVGMGGAFNEYDRERKGPGIYNLSYETAWRYGLARKTDVGLGPWLGLGLQLDVKHELTPREKRYGIALRGGGGFSAGAPNSFSAFLGTIASFEIFPWLTPYGGLAFRNFWFNDRTQHPPPTDGSEWAKRRGYGDGLLQATLGLRLHTGRAAIYLEYARWLPMQNDPGDFFKLVASHVFTLSVGFCLGPECRQG